MTPTLQPHERMRLIERAALVTGLLIAATLMWPLRGSMTDGTFVHLQYARHLSQGQGPVFNAGEHVYACTSPLWTALLADAMTLGWNGLAAAKVLGFLSTLLTIPLFLQLMRRTLRIAPIRAFATVAWSGHAWMLQWSVSGMETPLAVALTLGGFVAFTEGKEWGSRPVRTGALWALAALTRPEAVFLLVIWGIVLLIDSENREGIRRLVFGLLPPALIYGSWLVYARLFYGTFWPRVLVARAERHDPGFDLGGMWRQLGVLFQTDGVLMVLLVAALILGARTVWQRRRPPALSFLPWAWLLTLPALYVARDIPATSRYLVLLVPVLAWLAWRAADGWWLGFDIESPARRTQATVFGFTIATLVLMQNLGVYRGVVLPQMARSQAAIENTLVRWGNALHGLEDGTIASPEIGALGYLSGRASIDLTGLISPSMALALHQDPLAVEHFAFAPSRPRFVFHRASRPFELLQTSPYASALEPLDHGPAPTEDHARPDSVYSVYRIRWAAYDSLAQAR